MQKTVNRTPRYAAQDAYILEEIRGRYLNGTRQERLDVLQELNEASDDGSIPFEIAVLAVEDPDRIVRRWLAQNAKELDFTAPTSGKEKPNAERDLWNRLRADRDPFVRAALHENSNYPPHQTTIFRDWEKEFTELNALERLAFMRNPGWEMWGVNSLLLKIFDIGDSSLGLSIDERKALALAYLTNVGVEASREWHDWELDDNVKRLWAILPKFPDFDVQWNAFRYLGAQDSWKATAFKATTDLSLRQAILLNTTETDIETLALGYQDEECRGIASQKNYDPLWRKPSKVWRIVGHVWAGIGDVATFAIAILIFSKVDTNFERLVVTLLVYIYLTLDDSISSFDQVFRETMAVVDENFSRLRSATGVKLSYDERRDLAKQRYENREAFSKARTNYYIHSAFYILMWIVVVYNLVSALLV